MWAAIGAYLAGNWVQWIVGGFVTIMTFVIKHDIKTSKKYFAMKQDDFVKEIKDDILAQSKSDDAVLQSQVDEIKNEMDSLKAGILSMQGREFKAQCRALLDPNHTISIEEWEEIDADHDAYNGLGGNHTGDHLYDMVKKKFENKL